MKKTLLLLSLSLLFMYQCKKENKDIVDNNNNNNNKNVRVYCEIPMNSNGKSDFTNIFDGSVSWSSGSESVFLAVPGDNPKLIQLTTEGIEGNPDNLYFETYVSKNDITTDVEYDLWYLGNSMHREEEGEEEKGITPNVTINTNNETGVITSIDGSIAVQSGDLKDVGCFHIAKGTVRAVIDEEEDIVLTLETTMENQMSLAYLDLRGMLSEEGLTLSGNAITASGYTLSHDENGNFSMILNENEKTIHVTNTLEEDTAQYVVLLPNETHNVVLECGYLGGHTFKKGIEAGKFYYRKVSELQSEPLTLDENALPTLWEHDKSLDFRSGCADVRVNLIHDGGAETEYGAIYTSDMEKELIIENCIEGEIFPCEEYETNVSIPMEFNKRYKVRTYATNEVGTVYTDVDDIHYLEYVDMGNNVSFSTLNIEADNYHQDGELYKWGAMQPGVNGTASTEIEELPIASDITAETVSGRIPLAEDFLAFNDTDNYTMSYEYESGSNQTIIIGYTFRDKNSSRSICLKIGIYWTRKAVDNENAYCVTVASTPNSEGKIIYSGTADKDNQYIIRPVQYKEK